MTKKLLLVILMFFSSTVLIANSYKEYVSVENKSFGVDFSTFDIVDSDNSEKNEDETTTAQLSGKAFAFPSPAENGETEIGFRVVNAVMDIELSLYNAYGTKLYSISDQYAIGYNRIPINKDVIGFELPVGVYYFVLSSNAEVLAKNKFGVVRWRN